MKGGRESIAVKKSPRFWIVLALEVIALEIGAYAALFHQEHLQVFLLTSLLCLCAAIIGIAVTRAKAQAISSMILVLGIIAFSIGLYFLTVLSYHGHAYLMLGTGTLCLLVSLTGTIVTQYRAYTARR